MKNKISILAILFFISNSAFSSLVWNINDGINHFYKKDYQFCKNFFSSYIKSNPNDEDGYYWLAKTYQKLETNESNKKEEVKYFKKAYAISSQKRELEKINIDLKNTTNIEDYFDMAVEYIGNRHYKEADFYADMMLDLDPKSSSAYFIKAKIAKLNKNTELATEYLNKAIIYNNDILKTNLAKSLNIYKIPQATKETYRLCAVELFYKGEIKKAVANLEKYLKLEKNIDMYNLLIDCLIKLEDYNYALSLINEAKENDIKNLQTYLLEAKIYSINNKNDLIQKTLQEAYKINPNNRELLLAIGNYYLDEKEYSSANEYFKTLIEIDDNMYEAYFGLIYSLIKLNQNDDAIHLIRKISSLNQETSEIDFLLSQICINNGNYYEAIEYLEQAIKKENNIVYSIEKAKTHYLISDFENSIKELNKIKNIANLEHTKEINELLAKNYFETNQIEKLQNIISRQVLDKNRIIYKYYLYIISKNKSKLVLSSILNTKATKPVDYVDLSEIFYKENNIKEATKMINNGLKKYPKSDELMFEKNKLNQITK